MKVVKKELVNDDEVCLTSVIVSKPDIKNKTLYRVLQLFKL